MTDNNFYYGVVEDRSTDPLRLGRCKVRIVGIHTEDRGQLPTEELPWAMPIINSSSASLSGIGTSPVGLIEGSWVIITFMDPYKQFPLIVGSFYGIPQDPDKLVSNLDSGVYISDTGALEVPKTKVVNTPVTDGSGNTIVDGSGNPITTETEQTVQNAIVNPTTMSRAGIVFLKKQESLASLEKGRVKFGTDSTPGATLIYSYGDAGNYAIGWGNQFLENGSRVTVDTVLTKSQCDSLFELKLKNEFEPGVVRALGGAKVTQSMFDALCSMGYNMGIGRLSSTPVIADIKSGEYDTAASRISTTVITSQGAESAALKRRRIAEQELFKQDGLKL